MIINFPNLPKVGKFYWKLNVALLENEYIKESFQTKWIKIKNCINNYDTINDWWDRYAKSQIRHFFIEKGREESQRRYGLLEYLEFKLNRLYEKLNRTGQINYNEVKEIKDRIHSIKQKFLRELKLDAEYRNK